MQSRISRPSDFNCDSPKFWPNFGRLQAISIVCGAKGVGEAGAFSTAIGAILIWMNRTNSADLPNLPETGCEEAREWTLGLKFPPANFELQGPRSTLDCRKHETAPP